MLDDILTQGVAFYEAGNYPEARKKADEVLKIDPHNDAGWTLLYLCVQATGSQRDEIKLVTQWLEAVPASPLALEKLTLLAIWSQGPKWNKKKKAEALLESYQSTFPEDVETYKNLRCNYEIAHGSTAKAIKILQEMGEGKTEASALLLLQGWVHYKADHHAKALSFASQAIDMTPEEAPAWRLMAISAFRLARFGKARRAAKMALSLDPTFAEMKTLKTISPFGWFPVFFLSTLIAMLIYRIAALIPFPGIYRWLTVYGIIAVSTVLITLASIETNIFEGFNIGPFSGPSVLFWLGAAWYVIPELLMTVDEHQRNASPKPVNLKGKY